MVIAFYRIFLGYTEVSLVRKYNSNYFSNHTRKSSTRERLTVISKWDSGSDTILSLPPACLMMLLMVSKATIQLREILKNPAGSSSSEMTSNDESMIYL